MTPPASVSLKRETSTIESGWHRNSQVISDIINNVGGGKEIGEMRRRKYEITAPWLFLVPLLVDVEAGNTPRSRI